MKKKYTLTVGIPAYNEETRVESIVRDVLTQRKDRFVLKKIIILSDGSTDGTVNRMKKMKSTIKIPFEVVSGKRRRGKWFRVNQCFRMFDSDILVILDADIRIAKKNFLNEMVRCFYTDEKAIMVAAHQIPMKPDSFVGKIIYSSFVLWDYVRLSIPKYDHVQNYYGAATAFRRSFAKSLQIPYELGDSRTYLYVSAKKLSGFRYKRSAKVFYWTVTTFYDFLKLHERSFGVKNVKLEKVLGQSLDSVYNIPRKYKIRGIIKSFIANPFYTTLALALDLLVAKFIPRKKVRHSSLWEISLSSKKPIQL